MSMRWNKLCVAALSVAALIMPLAACEEYAFSDNSQKN